MKAIMRDKTELKKSGIKWIDDIPFNWKTAKIRNVIQSGRDGIKIGPFGSALTNKTSGDADYKIYGQANLVSGDFSDTNNKISKEVFLELKNYEVIPNDICISMMGTIGKCLTVPHGISKGIMDSHLIKIRLKETIDNRFFEYVYDKDKGGICFTQMQYEKKGSIMDGLNTTIVKGLYLPLPNFEEQQVIANYLDDRCSKIDAIIAEAKASIEEYKELKQAVIYEAVTKGLDKNVEMKDSGIEWIGKIPKTWEKIRIKYVLQIENGSDPLMEGEIPVYGSGADSFKTCGEFKNGPTVLLGRKGATLHIPHYIEGKYWNVDTAFNTLIKFSQSINMKYFYYLATCFDYKRYMSQTTLPSMTQTAYNNMIIPYPSYSEQNKIVQYLEQKLQQICMVISQKQSLIEELESYKKSLIYEVVTGKRKVVE